VDEDGAGGGADDDVHVQAGAAVDFGGDGFYFALGLGGEFVYATDTDADGTDAVVTMKGTCRFKGGKDQWGALNITAGIQGGAEDARFYRMAHLIITKGHQRWKISLQGYPVHVGRWWDPCNIKNTFNIQSEDTFQNREITFAIAGLFMES